ncbi:PREDICTED: serine/threonine-protein kinase STY46-like isoform X2 [Tarenaya hassleriana]|uniref:serine/threonine-protein kinase STY46-like isoform X2 n=1 Tax=Tarenaya hassleriana TaxID=28532 RepID=UPI00053C3E69|nr:PREDICTED: serine/threonine-protein kinase STY46-like isoform X2 [Tarenaya hassleriana]
MEEERSSTVDLTEGVGESSSPPRSVSSSKTYDVRTEVFRRLVETGSDEVIGNPHFKDLLDAHFDRFPSSYAFDVNLGQVDDVLLHMKVLALARDPNSRPVYEIRFLEDVDANGDQHSENFTGVSSSKADNDGTVSSRARDRDKANVVEEHLAESSSRRQRMPIYEVIFSSIDKPKLLSQLSALLSNIGLDIREAHVFSTNDGYSLDVFVVEGWPAKGTHALYQAVGDAIAGSKVLSVAEEHPAEWDIEMRILKIGEKISAGSCADLYRGKYFDQDVAIKMLRYENLNDKLEQEFFQEVSIMREIQHGNIVHFIGASTKHPRLWIVTEYMPGGSLYDYLHKHHKVLKLSQLLKFAIDVCKGMEYLHQNKIIHRDLKTANLLLDTNEVVKIADFGIARYVSEEGVMTAETGTYRWMAPEVMNHLPYDHKADVFSFGIVLWELLTAKVPYESMSPLQAAVGVRQGLRPTIPEDTHPSLAQLMQRCWDADPGERPPFSEIKLELKALISEVTDSHESNDV